MTTKGGSAIKDDSSSPRRNRADLLQPEFAPHPPVEPLGHDLLHGPALQDHIVVILGVGPGLGISIAQVFAQRGYITAILSRSKQRLENWADSLHETALAFRKANKIPVRAERLSAAFACDALDNDSITTTIQQVCDYWPDKNLGTACYNASIRKRGPFLEQRLDQVKDGVQGSILAGFTFAQATLRKFEQHGHGANLIVTGATSSTRGREGFAGFAASSEWTHCSGHVVALAPSQDADPLASLLFAGLTLQNPASERSARYVSVSLSSSPITIDPRHIASRSCRTAPLTSAFSACSAVGGSRIWSQEHPREPRHCRRPHRVRYRARIPRHAQRKPFPRWLCKCSHIHSPLRSRLPQLIAYLSTPTLFFHIHTGLVATSDGKDLAVSRSTASVRMDFRDGPASCS